MADSQGVKERREYYLSKAKEAEEGAASVKGVDSRRVIEQIAQSWRLLAWRVRDYLV